MWSSQAVTCSDRSGFWRLRLFSSGRYLLLPLSQLYNFMSWMKMLYFLVWMLIQVNDDRGHFCFGKMLLNSIKLNSHLNQVEWSFIQVNVNKCVAQIYFFIHFSRTELGFAIAIIAILNVCPAAFHIYIYIYEETRYTPSVQRILHLSQTTSFEWIQSNTISSDMLMLSSVELESVQNDVV